jgi:ABC-type glycerol-3-phosphate transport system permease component
VLLSTTPPASGQARKDWEVYVRDFLNVAFIRLKPSGQPALSDYLRQVYGGKIGALNRAWGPDKPYASFQEVHFSAGPPPSARAQSDLTAFVKNRAACPLDALSTWGPRQAFEKFIASRERLPLAKVAPIPLPLEAVDSLDFQERKGSLRWEFLTRNYLAVFDYLLLHGNAIRNTVIFCGLAIATTLLVNPLAAYALSRYRPPSTYTILLFCMATMAFPAEVTMIPSFLLLKRFPLYPLLIGLATAIAVMFVVHRMRPGWPPVLKGLLGIGIGIAAGWWGAPWFSHAVLGRPDASVSLLNTYWALILPGMANGYSIFLLKGFFDSLPRELYEAAEIDGAGEWTKFWGITMSLSKPILAVLALGAFTAAYSEFLMALVIIPDQKMWTITVWLYQLQSRAHPVVIYASLVVAAVPTFLIFLFCQNLIMRGIVVPVEK